MSKAPPSLFQPLSFGSPKRIVISELSFQFQALNGTIAWKVTLKDESSGRARYAPDSDSFGELV